MRLIDADALKKNMEFVCMGIMAGTESYKAPLKEIDNCPTIDPQPTHSNTPNTLGALESIQTTQLTDEDKETIRIHLNAFKESLCNQGRWYEATEYEELIHRLLSTLSVQPELSSNSQELDNKNGEWICQADDDIWNCSECDYEIDGTGCIDPLEYLKTYKFCPNCGARMVEEGEQE